MECKEISGAWVYFPERKIIGIVHFLGGAFVATAPQLSYNVILEEISKIGYVVVATPFINTFEHLAIAREVLNRFETVLERLKKTNQIPQGYLPIYGVGHSMGCKLHLLIGSLYQVERAGNILISFNNYPASQAIPLIEQLKVNSVIDINFEFSPSPLETKQIVIENYSIRRNLLIKFRRDDLDQTDDLNAILQKRFPTLTTFKILQGTHLTPLSQRVKWQMGELFTPIDAFGQWFNQEISKNLKNLQREVICWLNPLSSF